MNWGIGLVFLVLLFIITSLFFLPQILFALELWAVKRSYEKELELSNE